MLVIFSQDEYKVIMVAESHEQAWDKLLEYENRLIHQLAEDLKKTKSFFGDVQNKEPYADVAALKQAWSFEASTTEGIVEFERGDIVYV
jgi:hypothetical protein